MQDLNTLMFVIKAFKSCIIPYLKVQGNLSAFRSCIIPVATMYLIVSFTINSDRYTDKICYQQHLKYCKHLDALRELE